LAGRDHVTRPAGCLRADARARARRKHGWDQD
jgi:hypothetical protein